MRPGSSAPETLADVGAATTTGEAIRVRGLRVTRGGREVLQGVSLTVPRGQITGLLGPSGSGKTTLLRSIIGSQIIAGGTVEVLGQPAGSPSLRHRTGYVTQGLGVYGDLTVAENLRYFARVLDAPTSRAAEVLATVQLAGHADQLVNELSDGQRARVSLATVLLGQPELLVLDEPTVGLDPLLRRDLWATFADMAAAGATLIVASHVMDEAARCDHLVLLHDGHIIATGAPSELRAHTGAPDLEQAFLRLLEPRVAA
jgi:ABC-2 type transport system ATP-binding protein